MNHAESDNATNFFNSLLIQRPIIYDVDALMQHEAVFSV